MRRAFAVTAALGLIGVSALTASADTLQGTIPDCANVNGGAGTYNTATGALHVEVRLIAEPCSGESVTNEDGSVTTTEATYNLYVIRDKTWGGDPFNPEPNIFNVPGPGEADAYEFLSDAYLRDPLLVTEITAPGAHVITYDTTVDDNDPTVCVFSLVTGATVTTREVEVANTPSDENENGTTNDDTHSGNGGETNKSKEKFDWGTTTQTQETSVSFFDRAPTEDPGQEPLSSTRCLPIDAITTVVGQVVDDQGSSGGSGYN